MSPYSTIPTEQGQRVGEERHVSVEHMALVFEADDLSGPHKLLLLAYTNYTDPHGYCWPGIERLAADTGTSARTVKRTRKELEARNLLRHQRRTKGSGKSETNLYRVNIEKLRAMRRRPSDFEDNWLGLEFTDEPEPSDAPDQPKCQSAPPATSRSANLRPSPVQSAPPGGGNLHPDPSSDPSEIHHPDPEGGRTEMASPATDKHLIATELVGRVRQRGEFARVGAYESQVWQVRDDVEVALAAGHSSAAIEAYLSAKLDIADKVVFVRRAFEPTRLPDIAGYAPAPGKSTGTDAVPEWCGACDPEGRSNPEARWIEIDERFRRCPDCHPRVISGR